MNLRHAAALSLVGWYLIAPPTRVDREGFPEALPDKSGFFYHTDAPLSKWFNDGRACRRVRLVSDFSPTRSYESGYGRNMANIQIWAMGFLRKNGENEKRRPEGWVSVRANAIPYRGLVSRRVPLAVL